ncbi:glycyl-radical enzyme activating protein [Candidatus Woesearchaeota archaeon]|nr:glycyl-radical enzyme activating protein [Candidatus Woesearchaeota archaeon]
MAKGTIYKIQRFSIHDGPGIRTTIFFKGCAAKCWWCHNPESFFTPENNKLNEQNKDNEKNILGIERVVSVDELVAELEKDRIFYEQSGGGITLSGGEPLLQPEFLDELVNKCKDERHQYHLTLDTTGYADTETFNRIASKFDIVLYDLKLMNCEEHKQYAGIPNDMILTNLRSFEDKSKIIIRFPVIPSITDTEHNIRQIKELMLSLEGIAEIDLLPYHNFAEAKYARLGLEYRLKGMESPSKERIEEIKKYFEDSGFKAKIGG